MRAWPFLLAGMLLVEVAWLIGNVGDSEASDSIIFGTPLALACGALLGFVCYLTTRWLAGLASESE